MSTTKSILLTIMGTAALYSCRVNPRFSKLSEKEQQELTPLAIPITDGKTGQTVASASDAKAGATAQVFKVDGTAIQQIVAQNEITHVYIYASFCKPCVAELPAIMQLHKSNPTVRLVMVTPESWVDLNQVKAFLTARQIGFPTYILDAAKYGDEFSGVKRYYKLMNELYPNYSGRTGFPTHLLINQKHEVLYATAGAGRFGASVLDSVMRARR